MDTSITIRHLTGTLKGKEQVITAQEASLGTGPGNTVRLDPVWDKGVSINHARLFRDASGGWVLEDAGSGTGTFLNGTRITTRRPVTGSIVLELGHGGPKIEVMLPAGQGLPGASAGPRAAGAGAGRQGTGGGLMKVMAIAALIAVLGVAAFFFMGRSGGSGSSGGSDTDTKLQQVAKSYEEGIGLVIIPTEEGTVTATAWAVTPTMFATNAHVASPARECLENGGTAYVVINKHPEQRFRIKNAIFPSRFGADLTSIDGKGPATMPYAVGLLVIEGHANVTLRLASPEKLRSLDSGHRVAFLGFPAEGLAGHGVDIHNPVATMQSGILTATTDFWLAQSAFENRLLLQHNLPITGGASGSPMFDASGDVIGVISSGNMVGTMDFGQWAQVQQAKKTALEQVRQSAKAAGQALTPEEEKKKVTEAMSRIDHLPVPVGVMVRAPSAALVNFAQRIDMLQELISLVDKAGAEKGS